MAHHAPVKDDPQQLADAQKFWSTFTQYTKWGVIGIAVLLLILAGAFIPF